MVVNEFFYDKSIAENFNKFFSEVGPKLRSKIPHSLISFEHFLQGDYHSLEEKPIIDDELNEALQTLKTNRKSWIWWDCFCCQTYEPMRYIFNLPIEKCLFFKNIGKSNLQQTLHILRWK